MTTTTVDPRTVRSALQLAARAPSVHNRSEDEGHETERRGPSARRSEIGHEISGGLDSRDFVERAGRSEPERERESERQR